MPSTYSQSLKLELIATGEQSGTWGITTDNNMQLVEQGVAGWGYPVFTLDSDLSVLISDAILSPGRAAVLWVTSSVPLTAARNMILSPVPKTWIIHNGTTGGQPIYVKTASGTGVWIGNGARQQVTCDGATIITSVNSLGGQFALSGVITAPQLTNHVVDWNPPGLADAAIVRVWSNAPTWGILGLAGGVNGRLISLVNAGSTTVVLFEEHAASAPANRFIIGFPTLWMEPNSAVTLMYDAGNVRWRVMLPTFDGVPVGTILDFPGPNLPPRCVWAAGQYLPQAQYARLYAAYGGTYGISGIYFAVPDLRGRTTAGRDDMGGTGAGRLPAWGVGAGVGEYTHVISGNELPYHGHGISDPTHAHGLADPGHAHGVSDPQHQHPTYDPGHGHNIGDPGHGHGIGDPGHSHDIPQTNVGGPGGYTILGGNPGAHRTFAALTGIYTGASGTGIWIGASGTGVVADWTTTRLWINASGTGMGVYGAGTGISVAGAGANWGMSLLQPTMILNKIIYAGA